MASLELSFRRTDVGADQRVGGKGRSLPRLMTKKWCHQKEHLASTLHMSRYSSNDLHTIGNCTFTYDANCFEL